jgi:pimeloyl-ACP methyl ester carboxylesterase
MKTYRNTRLRNGLLAAAVLAGTAYWVRRGAKQAERKHPPTGKFVDVDGVRLHYIERGNGPNVLLIHGANMQATDFQACGLVDTLASRYRVVAFDRPGFGYSERPRDRLWTPRAQAMLLAKACAAIRLEAPIVFGHSLGTLVALALAIDTTLPVRGLVLASGYYFPTFLFDNLMLAPVALPILGDAMRYTVSPLLGKLMTPAALRRVFAPREVDQRFVQAVAPLTLRPWQLKAYAEDSVFMIPAAARLARHYAQLSLPVEIIAGADDKYVDQHKHSGGLQEQLAHSRLTWIAGEGHMLHYRASAEIAAAIDRIVAAQQRAEPLMEAGRQPLPGAAASRPDVH